MLVVVVKRVLRSVVFLFLLNILFNNFSSKEIFTK